MSIKKQKIGIVGWSLGDNSWGVQKTYLDYFSQFGQVEILTPDIDIREDIDLVVLPGGQDVQTAHYPVNTPPGFMNSLSDPFKDYFFKNNLQKYIDAGKSILGICLGEQQLALHFGVPLIQNISPYHGYSSDGDDKKHNKCQANKEFLNSIGLGSPKTLYPVNSFHHQGVALEDLINYSKGQLIPILHDPNSYERVDGSKYQIVEMFAHATLPIIGIQSHPEKATECVLSSLLVQYLLKRANNKIEVKNNVKQLEEA